MNSRSHSNRHFNRSTASIDFDVEFLAAVEEADFDTVLRLMNESDLRAESMSQDEWLLNKAIAAGYRSLEAVEEADPKRYEKWCVEWDLAQSDDASKTASGRGAGEVMGCFGPAGEGAPPPRRFLLEGEPEGWGDQEGPSLS